MRDGTGTDISTTSSTTQLAANWDASTDYESGITGYQYAIGTSAGGTQTVNWTTLGNVTTVTKTGLSLTVGQTYYFSVKAVNGAGLTGSATNSNGQTVTDTTPPSAPPTVRDGTGTDVAYTTSTTQLVANWDASTDNESGISGYQYAIGTSAGGTQTVNWTSLGNVTTVTKTGLALTSGQTYYFSVKAVNGAGLTGSATNSNGQTVDSTAPSAARGTGWNGNGHLHHRVHNPIVRELGRQHGQRERHQRLPIRHRHLGRRHANRQLDFAGQRHNGNEDWLDVDRRPDLLLQRQGRQRRRTDRQRHEFRRPDRGISQFRDLFPGQFRELDGAWRSMEQRELRDVHAYAEHEHGLCQGGRKSLKLTDTDTTAIVWCVPDEELQPRYFGRPLRAVLRLSPHGYGSANMGCTRRLLRVGVEATGPDVGQRRYPMMEEVGVGAILAASAISENAWHCLEIHMAPPSASTLMEFWVDGKRAGTLNGSFSGSTTYDHIDLRRCLSWRSGRPTATARSTWTN